MVTPDYCGEDGYIIPLDRRTALAVHRRARPRPALRWHDGQWLAAIDHRSLGDEAHGMNRALANSTRSAVFGRTKELVESVAEFVGVSAPYGPSIFPEVVDVDLECHIYDYFRVASAITVEPPAAQAAADCVNWSAIADRAWTGPVVVQMLFPERTGGGVIVRDDELYVDLGFGAAVRERRRAAGDFRKGAMGLMDLSQVRANQGKIAHNASRIVNLASFDTPALPDET